MGFIERAGTFTTSTGTGNQTISNVGFRAQGLYVVAVAVTSESAAVDAITSYGLTDGTRTKCAGVKANDGTTETDRIQTENQIINLLNDVGSTVNFAADFVEFTEDGFIINITANVDSAAYLINYVAFGGADNLKVDQTLGNSSPVTGVGFTGNLIIAICAGQGAGTQGSIHAINAVMGCAERFSGSTRQWWMPSFWGEDDRANTGGQIRDDGFIGQRYNTGVTWNISFTTFDADGFTFGGTTNSDVFYYMMIELPTGIEAFATTHQKPTGAAPATQTFPDATGFGNDAQGYIVATAAHTSKTTVDDTSPRCSVGAYSVKGGVRQWAIGTAVEIAAGTQADMRSDDNEVLYEMALGGGTDSSATPNAISSSQVSVEWNPNSSVAIWVGILVFESDNTYHINGTTRKEDGTVSANGRVVLIKRDAVAEASRIYEVFRHQNSDGSGLYDFTLLLDNDSQYMVFFWNDDTPEIRGLTDDFFTPALET